MSNLKAAIDLFNMACIIESPICKLGCESIDITFKKQKLWMSLKTKSSMVCPTVEGLAIAFEYMGQMVNGTSRATDEMLFHLTNPISAEMALFMALVPLPLPLNFGKLNFSQAPWQSQRLIEYVSERADIHISQLYDRMILTNQDPVIEVLLSRLREKDCSLSTLSENCLVVCMKYVTIPIILRLHIVGYAIRTPYQLFTTYPLIA